MCSSSTNHGRPLDPTGGRWNVIDAFVVLPGGTLSNTIDRSLTLALPRDVWPRQNSHAAAPLRHGFAFLTSLPARARPWFGCEIGIWRGREGKDNSPQRRWFRVFSFQIPWWWWWQDSPSQPTSAFHRTRTAAAAAPCVWPCPVPPSCFLPPFHPSAGVRHASWGPGEELDGRWENLGCG